MRRRFRAAEAERGQGMSEGDAPRTYDIAQILKAAGYRTGHFGTWHVGPVKKESPLNPNRMGFDEYLSHDNFFEMNPPLSRNGAPPESLVEFLDPAPAEPVPAQPLPPPSE